jgi:hypothetical protein
MFNLQYFTNKDDKGLFFSLFVKKCVKIDEKETSVPKPKLLLCMSTFSIKKANLAIYENKFQMAFYS